jgi:hypothetical protein
MGRWRSGAPLGALPGQDDPALGGDRSGRTIFCTRNRPARLSLSDRRPHPPHEPARHRENMQRRKMIRRGGTYGRRYRRVRPDDGVERGIAAFIGCSSLIRQFEFAMNVWVNDPKFKDLDNERDPIIGNHDGTFDMTIPKRPIRKRLRGLPALPRFAAGRTSSCPVSGAAVSRERSSGACA